MVRHRFGLRLKFVLIIVLILAAIFLTFAYVLVRSNVQTLSTNQNQETISFTELATDPIGDIFNEFQFAGTIRIAQTVQQYADLNGNITNFSIVDTSGMVLFSQSPGSAPQISAAEAGSFIPIYKENSRGNISQAIVPYFEDTGARRYSVVYDISDAEIQQTTDQQISIIVTFLIAALIASIIIMYGLVEYHFILPIKSLSQQALAISAGNFDVKIETQRRDEVADLTQAVNDMAKSLQRDIEKLEQLDNMKSEFLTIVSHNLRTPLTIIKGFLDNADIARTKKDLEDIIANLQSGAQRLSDFAEDMITIARIEAGQSIGSKDSTTVDELLKPLLETADEQSTQKNIKLSKQIEAGDEKLEVNISLARSAINGILDNALKFTSEGGAIHVKVTSDKKMVYISVADTGIGIAEGEKEALFTKFHRGTSVLTYNYEGTGIGLYSARLVIQQHGGDIVFDSTEGQGSTFTISLPKA